MDVREVIELMIEDSPRNSNYCHLNHEKLNIADVTYIVVHTDALRKWIASFLHRGTIEYLPKIKYSKIKHNEKTKLPTHIKAHCSCKEFEFTLEIDHTKLPNDNYMHGLTEKLSEEYEKHYVEAVNALTCEYRENYQDFK